MVENKRIKLALLGDKKTGKTLFTQYLRGSELINFDNYISTNGASYIEKKIIYNNSEYFLDIWDTSGEEKYFALTKFFIMESNMVFIFYDSNNKETFERAKEYFDLAKEYLNDKKVVFVLVSSKYDLALNSDEENNKDNNNAFNEEEVFEYAEQNHILLSHISISEKYSKGIIELFRETFKEYTKKNNIII